MFAPKSFVEIVSGMIAHMRATQKSVTDFHVGSVARTLVEAPAVEMDELYQSMAQGLTDAIPVALYDAFGFEALPAVAAGGTVRILADALVDDPVLIPAGTLLTRTDPTLEYQTVADATIAHGTNHVDVVVVAKLAGPLGNAPVGTALALASNVGNQLTAATTTRLTGGADAESETERAARFIDYVDSLSHGTVNAIRYAVSQISLSDGSGVVIERVARVGISESAGHVGIYIYGSHGAPSADLLAAAQVVVDGDGESIPIGMRAAGVRADVLPMTEQTISLAYKVKLFAGLSGGDAILNAIRTQVETLLSGIKSGDVLFVESLVEAALNVSGVERALIESDTNLTCPANKVFVLGAVTVEYL